MAAWAPRPLGLVAVRHPVESWVGGIIALGLLLIVAAFAGGLAVGRRRRV